MFQIFTVFYLVTTLSLSFSATIKVKKNNLEADTLIKNKILDTFEFAKSIRGDKFTRLHYKFFGKLDGQNYVDLINNSVKSINLNVPLDPNMYGMADVRTKEIDLSNIVVQYSFIRLLESLIHEAWHIYSGKGHALCPEYSLKGEPILSINGTSLKDFPACDNEISGSYAVTLIMHENIRQYCDSCAQDVREISAKRVISLSRLITDQNVYDQLANDFGW